MTEVNDGFDAYYAERLWQLLPAAYRIADSDSSGAAGPLRELIDRIGAQVAVVRRSIDRLWADQSIETCDDWVIPYLGDLLGTNLVTNLDAAAQRLDVAKTIYYRRRKGTMQVLTELATDTTGWPAVVVEGFRRLARTRHGLDPAVGAAAYPQASPADVATLLQEERLTGLLTGGLAGGYADLRSAHGAALVGTAFDESFHTADLRAGQGDVGHFGIAKLLVFLWRLRSFPVAAGTPVIVADCSNQYVFDPTGRQIPLFLPPPQPPSQPGGWTPLLEWQMPGPLTSSLVTAVADSGLTPPLRPAYPDAIAVPAPYAVNGATVASLWPELGRFETSAEPTEPFTVSYQYGFSSTVGAGPYDRDLLGDPPAQVGGETVVTGGGDLTGPFTQAGTTGTVTINDSLTYARQLPAVGSTAAPVVSLLVRAGPSKRPVLRPATAQNGWVFTGGGQAELVLDGLTVSGCDIVLRGAFSSVRITACTIDPGTAAYPVAAESPPLATAADGPALAPCRIFIEGDPGAPPGDSGVISRLSIDRSITGPVRTRYGGSVETLTITDSIVQGLPATSGTTYTSADIFDPALLAKGLLAQDPLAAMLRARLAPSGAVAALREYLAGTPASQRDPLNEVIFDGLNELIGGLSLYDPGLFAAVSLSAHVTPLTQATTLDPASLPTLNRGLLDESFPVALSVAAVAVADAEVQLARVTVLGQVAAHRLAASDSILRDFTAVDDTQDGCVRFCAYSADSALPRQYESVGIPPRAAIFTTDRYGEPGYAQLSEAATSVLSGAENGSEMGAFSADLNAIREQGLLIKYAEYMPLGLTPVIVHVT